MCVYVYVCVYSVCVCVCVCVCVYVCVWMDMYINMYKPVTKNKKPLIYLTGCISISYEIVINCVLLLVQQILLPFGNLQ